MNKKGFHMVTGAFGYTGRYIAERLLAQGQEVRTLTNSTERQSPFGDKVKAYPYNFDNHQALVESLKGCSVLYNTYWVRFNHKSFTHSEAVENTKKLFAAAREAGVGRVVHVSITNPSEESHLEYFHGKGVLERALRESGLSYAILRPAVIFGREDILIHNIAWFVRRFPVFGVFGDGKYRLQPIHVEDMASLAIEQGQRTENKVIEAIGPESYSFEELVRLIGKTIGKPRPIIRIPPRFGYVTGWLAGKIVNDVIITREEIDGLMADLLHVDAPPAGKIRLSEWLKENVAEIGTVYRSELARRRDRSKKYMDL